MEKHMQKLLMTLTLVLVVSISHADQETIIVDPGDDTISATTWAAWLNGMFDDLYTATATNSAKETNTVTNIAITETPTYVTVASSDGTNDNIALADINNSGVMSPAQYTAVGLLDTASTRAVEDTMTDGSNIPDGAAIKAYGDSNWSADDTAYNATSWDANTDAATKNAIRDKIESLAGGHDSVTLGTANGLSLSTQELSLAAATTSSPGAFTAAQATLLAAHDAVIPGDAVDTEYGLRIDNNTTRAPTASAMEIYPEANVWKMNSNGVESTITRDTEIVKANTNIEFVHLNSTILGAVATAPDPTDLQVMMIPFGVDYGDFKIVCNGTSTTGGVVTFGVSSTYTGTYTALSTTTTLNGTTLVTTDMSGETALTAGQFLGFWVSTANAGTATACDGLLELFSN